MDKIDLENVNIKIKNGTLDFPKKLGEYRSEATLNEADVEIEFDPDQLEDEYLCDILKERGFYISEQYPSLDDYTDTELMRETSHRGYAVYDNTVTLQDFDANEMIAELERRDAFIPYDLSWYLKNGKYEDFLIHLERSNPVDFSGLSKMRLVKE